MRMGARTIHGAASPLPSGGRRPLHCSGATVYIDAFTLAHTSSTITASQSSNPEYLRDVHRDVIVDARNQPRKQREKKRPVSLAATTRFAGARVSPARQAPALESARGARTVNGIEAASPGGGSARRAKLVFSRGSVLCKKGLHHVVCILVSAVDNGLSDSVAAPSIKTQPFAALGPAASRSDGGPEAAQHLHGHQPE